IEIICGAQDVAIDTIGVLLGIAGNIVGHHHAIEHNLAGAFIRAQDDVVGGLFDIGGGNGLVHIGVHIGGVVDADIAQAALQADIIHVRLLFFGIIGRVVGQGRIGVLQGVSFAIPVDLADRFAGIVIQVLEQAVVIGE